MRLVALLLMLWSWICSTLGQGVTSSVQFREGILTEYGVEMPEVGAARAGRAGERGAQWLKAWPRHGAEYVWLGRRVVLELKPEADLGEFLAGTEFKVARRLAETVFIVEGPTAAVAIRQAALWASDPMVVNCYPVAIRPKKLHSNYASRPNDPYFYRADHPNTDWQAYLENRADDGRSLGIDLNIRSAWAISRGENVLIAIGDDGVDLGHPDLAPAAVDAPNFNFFERTTNGFPTGPSANHGTAVAGLAAARGDNRIGIAGAAPQARIASWVLFNARDRLEISDEQLMDMFQYQSNIVSIQNHSWGKSGAEQLTVSSVEGMAISNAVTLGRSGRGVIIVRAGGNGRMANHNANDDGYLADPRVIGVAAVRLDGRVARYSTAGANLLVAAPSGDIDDEPTPCGISSPNLLTTDRRGADGFNFNSYTNDLANYGFGPSGFAGTSASTPLVSGLAALLLGANPSLGYRDVQQILIHSARHFDLADPDLKTNSAGFRASHNLGFGVPDAGLAVRLAQRWVNRPELKRVTYESTETKAIPDQGLRLRVTGENVPSHLASIVALPGSIVFPNQPTASLVLEHVGTTAQGVTNDLRGRAALIQRGENFFCEKLSIAAAAGAGFSVVYNNRDFNTRIAMGATDFSPVPAVFISEVDGEGLRDFILENAGTRGSLALEAVQYTFTARERLLCEHVGVQVDTDHTARGDLRITLTSPHGTRSVLQTFSGDSTPGPREWTYYSTHHFYESSVGKWTVSISDLDGKGTGQVKSVRLILTGVGITDSDADGLDDQWEIGAFGGLAAGAQEDPDEDGFSNIREFIMTTNPREADALFKLDLSSWSSEVARLSWPSSTNYVYRVRTGVDAVVPLSLTTNVPGKFFETEWFTPYTNLLHQFYQVERVRVESR